MPFLLYLEWLLLLLMLFFSLGQTILPNSWFLDRYHPAFLVFLIFCFGSIGFYLPTNKSFKQKIIFTSLEFLLILVFGWVSGLRSSFLPYVIIVIRSCFLFEIIGQLCILVLVGICSFISWYFLYQKGLSLLKPQQFTNILTSLGILFFVLIMINSLIKEYESRKALIAANQKLKEYYALAEEQAKEQAKLQERHRIARDIHDSLGHSLTGLNLQLEAALQLWKIKPEKSYNLVSASRQLAKTCLEDVRYVVREFRSQKSLEETLLQLTQEVMRWSNIEINLVFKSSHFIPKHIETEVYRVVQESLNNIVKHSQATLVNICLKTSNVLKLNITDNGQGFEIGQKKLGFGLININERINGLGGTCQIQSHCGEGTIIDIIVPLLESEL